MTFSPITELEDILPGIINQLGMYSWLCLVLFFIIFSRLQMDINFWLLTLILKLLGPDNLDNLRKLAEQFQKQAPSTGADATTTQEEDDDEVPELVAGQTFEAAAEEGQAAK